MIFKYSVVFCMHFNVNKLHQYFFTKFIVPKRFQVRVVIYLNKHFIAFFMNIHFYCNEVEKYCYIVFNSMVGNLTYIGTLLL